MLANLLPEACGVGGRWSVVGGGCGPADLDLRHFALTLVILIFYLLFYLHWVETISFSGFFLPLLRVGRQNLMPACVINA